MKRKLITLAAGVALISGLVSGCGAAASGESEKVIRVGAGITPHAEILETVSDGLKEQGYTLEIVEYNDYVLPNTALEDGDLDANFSHLGSMRARRQVWTN